MRSIRWVPSLLLASLLILESVAPAAQAGRRGKEFPLPTSPSYPQWITGGSDGNVSFTENIGNIGRITPAGVITEFAVPTENSQPEGIAAGPDGNLWFAEAGGNKIGRITPAGVITEFPIPN